MSRKVPCAKDAVSRVISVCLTLLACLSGLMTARAAHLSGVMVDENANPVPNVVLAVSDGLSPFSVTNNGDGSFDFIVPNGTWSIQASIPELNQLNLVGAIYYFDVTNDISNVTLQAYHATAQITGTVQTGDNAPATNVLVNASAQLNAFTYSTFAYTDSTGHYQIGVFDDLWNVSFDQSDLEAKGFSYSGSPQFISISSGNNGTADFTVDRISSPQIDATTLPSAPVGSDYRVSLTASGGQTPFTWTVISNALPPGLTLSFDEFFGYISGTPTATGVFYFTVQVTDANFRTDQITFYINISSPHASGGDWNALLTGSLDGDAHPDVLWQNGTNFVESYLSNTSVLSFAPISYATSGTPVAALDFDQNNQTDLLVLNEDGTLSAWLMNGTNVLSTTTLRNGHPIPNGARVVGIGNFSTNGNSGVLLQDLDGSLLFWFFNQTNFVAENGITSAPATTNSTQAVAVGDFDHDGHLDILWQASNGQLSYWALNGTNFLHSSTLQNPTPVPTDWRIIGAADFDGDGNTDILWQSQQSGSLFFWRVVNGVYDGQFAVSPAVESTPIISSEPQSQTISDGDAATFEVNVTGDTPFVYPLSYQWQFNGTNIAGATDASFTLVNAHITDSGQYSVSISNPATVISSDAATLTVNATSPLIALASHQTVRAGYNATVSASVSGTEPLVFQWSINGTNIPGATNASLILTNVQSSDSGSYLLSASNIAGDAQSSVTVEVVSATTDVQLYAIGKSQTFVQTSTAAAVLDSANRPFEFTTLVIPTAAEFVSSVTVTPPSGTVQTIGLDDDGQVLQFKTNFATLTALDGTFARGNYLLQINSTYDGTKSLTLTMPTNSYPATPHISNFTAAQSINSAANFSVSWDAISGATTNDFIQFQIFGDAGTIFSSPEWMQPGALNGRSTSITIPANTLDANRSYEAKLMVFKVINRNTTSYPGATGATLFAKRVQFTIATVDSVIPPSIAQQPGSLSVIAGESATFSANAEGSSLAYQWRLNGKTIANATDNSLTINNAQTTNAGSYSVTVSNSAGSLTSSNAVLIVLVPPTISTQPHSQSVLAGKTVTLNVVASGTTPLSYAWLLRSSDTVLSTSSALTFANAQPASSGSYFVVVSNAAGTITSSDAVVTISAPVRIAGQPQTTTIVQGSSTNLSVTATGTAPLFYQWFFNGTRLADATNSVLDFASVEAADAGVYRVVVSNAANSVTSSNATLIVTVPPSITTQPASQTVAVGATASLSVTATGTAPLHYQWQCNGTNLTGATKASLSLTGVTLAKSGSYSVTITNIAGRIASDSAVLAVVPPAPAISSPGANTQTTNTLLLIQGHAATNAGVTAISYVINDSLPQTATGTINWSTTVPLTAGTNTFRVKALNASGESRETVITYFRLQTNILHVTINGLGTISPNWTNQPLLVGRNYSLAAVPGRGQIFAGWSGGADSSSTTLSFIMEPGLQLQANFVTNLFIGVAGTYNGLFHDPFYLANQSAGFITLNVSSNQSFSGKILLDGATNSFSSKFDAAGHVVFSLPRKTGGALTADWQIDLTGGSDQITGTLGNDIFNANLVADRATFTTAHPATNFSGAYTVLIPGGTNSVAMPSGYSYSIANINPAGVASASGFLGDGTAFNSSVAIAKDGRWPIYVPLYGGQGSIGGWLQLTNSPVPFVTGTLFWFKNPLTTGNFYRSGFTMQSNIFGSFYVKPQRGVRALNVSSGTVTFIDGNLSEPLVNSFVLSTNNVFTITGTNRLSISLNITNGVFSGSFVHPVTHATTPIKGAISQWYGFGAGYFLGTNQSGSIVFQNNQ